MFRARAGSQETGRRVQRPGEQEKTRDDVDPKLEGQIGSCKSGIPRSVFFQTIDFRCQFWPQKTTDIFKIIWRWVSMILEWAVRGCEISEIGALEVLECRDRRPAPQNQSGYKRGTPANST